MAYNPLIITGRADPVSVEAAVIPESGSPISIAEDFNNADWSGEGGAPGSLEIYNSQLWIFYWDLKSWIWGGGAGTYGANATPAIDSNFQPLGTANSISSVSQNPDGSWEHCDGDGTCVDLTYALDALSDVDSSLALENQVLMFNGTSWVAGDAPGDVEEAPENGTPYSRQDGTWVVAITDLDGLSDVDVSAPTNGQVLTFDDTQWIAADIPEVPMTLDDLIDVEASVPQDNQILVYDANGSPPGWYAESASGGGGVGEAPEDGTPYGRQDASWISIPEEAPVDTYDYVRKDGEWVSNPKDRTSELMAVWARAAPGESFTKGQVVQMVDFVEQSDIGIGGAYGEKYKEWNVYDVTEVRPNSAYSVPNSTTGRIDLGTVGYSARAITTADERYATKFSIKDMAPDTGAIDWKINKIRTDIGMNTFEKTQYRFGVYADNGGVPGAVLWDHTQFDWREFVIDGVNAKYVYPLVDMVLQNAQTYWIVTEFIGESVFGLLKDFLTSDPYNVSEYIFTPIEDESVRYTIDGGIVWGSEPDGHLPRLRVYVDIDTEIIPPSSSYGIVYSDLDEFIPGAVALYGGVSGDISGAQVGETWEDNDVIYIDITTKSLTNVKPSDPLDIISVARVLKADPTEGTLYVTAQVSAQRGLWMPTDVYDPNKRQGNVFNLNNIVDGVLDASRVTVDDSGFAVISGTDAQLLFQSIDDNIGSGGIVDIDDNPPANPASGDLWWSEATGIMAVYNVDTWVQVN